MNKEENELVNVWRNTRPNLSRSTCFMPGCSVATSKNHLLMQNGILSEMGGDKRHVRELRTNRARPRYYAFERIGLGNALAMHGLCQFCDNLIFGPIEHPAPVVPVTLADACRYSLRPVLHEIKKKQQNLKFFAKIPANERDYLNFGSTSPLDRRTRIEITLLTRIFFLIHEGISKNVPLSYCVRRLRRAEICASALLLPPQGYRIRHGDVSLDSVKLEDVSFNVINIFPQGKELIVISLTMARNPAAGKLQDTLINSSEITIQRKLSNILISQIEDWAISEELYARLPNAVERIIDTQKQMHADFYADIGLNLFAY